MPRFIAPAAMSDVFTCPHCDVTAKQKWYSNNYAKSRTGIDEKGRYINASPFLHECSNDEIAKWAFCECEHCKTISVWHSSSMIYPEHCPVDEPNADMPLNVRKRYIEASKVIALSPVSAAALLRLALQILLQEVLQEESSGEIYKDIQVLKERPIDSSLVKAFDIIRISGNESVHPGTLDLNESIDDALYLFDLLNMICDQFFTQPRKMQEMYEKMPESKRIISD